MGVFNQGLYNEVTATALHRLLLDKGAYVPCRLKVKGRRAYCACEMLGGFCPGAARVLEAAEPDALAYLDFPQSHWKRLRTNNVQERTNREIKRRSRVVQVFPSMESPGRLVGAVMCDQDEEWQDARYFSEERMAELWRPAPAPEPPDEGRGAEPGALARQAIEASLGLADRLEAA